MPPFGNFGRGLRGRSLKSFRPTPSVEESEEETSERVGDSKAAPKTLTPIYPKDPFRNWDFEDPQEPAARFANPREPSAREPSARVANPREPAARVADPRVADPWVADPWVADPRVADSQAKSQEPELWQTMLKVLRDGVFHSVVDLVSGGRLQSNFSEGYSASGRIWSEFRAAVEELLTQGYFIVRTENDSQVPFFKLRLRGRREPLQDVCKLCDGLFYHLQAEVADSKTNRAGSSTFEGLRPEGLQPKGLRPELLSEPTTDFEESTIPEGLRPEGQRPGSQTPEGLVLSDPPADLCLPISGAASMTGAILAKKNMGKTYLAGVLAEEMMKAKIPLVIFDPNGVWWGLGAMAGGANDAHSPEGLRPEGLRPEGLRLEPQASEPQASGPLPVVILGGSRGLRPLVDGVRLANVVSMLCRRSEGSATQGSATQGSATQGPSTRGPIPVVIDMSELPPVSQHELVADFCERLVVLPKFPLHVIIDEANEFAPQRLSGGPQQRRCLDQVERLVMRGRARGVGVTLVSLRPAVVSKNVLAMVDSLWLLRLTEPADLEAVSGRLEHRVTSTQLGQCLGELPELPRGMAFFLGGKGRTKWRRFKVRLKRTYDSSRTPSGEEQDDQVRLIRLDPKLVEVIEACMAEPKVVAQP